MASIKTIFTNIANAIREKKGTTTKYLPENMSAEISTIETGIDTSDATATSGDILLDKTAYANGEKIVGTIQTYNNEHENGYVQINALKKLLDATTSAYYLFKDYTGTSVDDLIQYSDTENVTNMELMFDTCSNLQTIPLLDTSSVTSMRYMFYYCKKLTTVPLLNTSKVTNMEYMFYQCNKLQIVPRLDTSSVTNMGYMFYYCYTLQDIPHLNTSNVTKMYHMFEYCSSLVTIPLLDTSKVTDMGSMFYTCSNLQTIPLLNMINVTSTSSMFNNCKALTNLTLLNIKIDLQIGSGTSWGHLLTLDSLINTIMELWNYSDGSKSPKLTMGSANLEKIANTYVLVTDETTDKMTAEVCDSTTEGAITLEAFANKKGWTLA